MRGYLWILAAALMWGTLGPVARRAFAEGLAPLEVAFWRAVLAWGCFTVHALAVRRFTVAGKDMPMITLFALTGVTMFYSSYQLAVQQGGAALAAVLLYTAPAWVAVMSKAFFKESMGALKIGALVATLTGVATIAVSSGSSIQPTPLAVTYGLMAGFSYSLYYILGKYFQGRYSAPNLFFYILPIGAAGLWPWVHFGTKTPMAWLCLAFLAVLSTYGAYYCYYTGLKYLEPTRAAIAATLEPVIAALVAFYWWGEYFSWQGYIGSGLILGSVLVMVVEGARKSSAEQA